MKKFFSFIAFACLFATTSNAQYDLEVNLISPASGASATGAAGFTISYSVTNNGPNEVPAGDTLFLAILHSDANFSLNNGAAGSVSILVLPAAIPSGTTLVSSTVGLNGTANLSGVDGPVCLFVAVGEAGFTTIEGDPNDTDMDNNADCFISVPASADMVEQENFSVLEYPNPATDLLSIAVEGDQIISVSIIGMDGRVISTVEGSIAQVADLTAGVYIYEARTASGAVVRNSFVKK
jgi:hypothetical protein